MFKRSFFALVGLGAGVAVGVWAVRKLEQTSAKLSPEHLGGAAAARAGALRERLAVALDEGRRAAGEKESELRLHYRGDEATQSLAATQSPAAAQRPAPTQTPTTVDDPSMPDAH